MRTLAITGARGGLGTSVVARLQNDYRCLPLDHDTIDVTSEPSVVRAFEEIGELYGLVHLVGGFTPGVLNDTALDAWNRMLQLNLTGAFLTMREALKRMSHPGRIIVVSSMATLRPAKGSAAYTVAKSALNALVQVAAAEQKGSGITVNAVLPDSMATPAMLQSMEASKLVPLERVAETIAFLLSDAAAGTSGTLIPIGA